MYQGMGHLHRPQLRSGKDTESYDFKGVVEVA